MWKENATTQHPLPCSPAAELQKTVTVDNRKEVQTLLDSIKAAFDDSLCFLVFPF